MGALGMIAVLVGGVGQLNVLAIFTGVLELTLHLQSLHVSYFLQITLLISTDAIAGFKGVLVRAVAVYLAVLADNWDRLRWGLGSGERHGDE